MSGKCLTIILAAGEGKRMKSKLPKVLHPVAGLPMLMHILDTSKEAGSSQSAVVVGNQADLVKSLVSDHDQDASIFVQSERKGTAHAVLAAREAVTDEFDQVIILNGDVPLIRPQTIESARQVIENGADVAVLGFETDDPTGYGRMVMHGNDLVAIREHKDASDEERSITFCNSGIFSFSAKCMIDILDRIGSNNAQGEYYLPDAIEIARDMGLTVSALKVEEEETLGVNDRVQLSQVEAIWQSRRRDEAMLAGVSMSAPDTVLFSHDTVVGEDSVIEPNVVFGKGVDIGSGVTIKAFSHLEDTSIDSGSSVGPYARLRPGTVIGKNAKIGNFVETKKTVVADGAKINHLSYIGDANVGAGANIGAGTITCNYDGVNKHHTEIGDGAFIGTNTSLVAPVNVGKDAMTGAGSVVTNDVEADALAIARNKQINLPNKAAELWERNRAIKAAKKK